MRMAFGETFDVPAGYLNTAAIGIPPARVAEAVAESVLRWRTGADDPARFDQDVATARAGWAELVGLPVEQVAIGATGSHLVGLVAAGVPAGTRVLVVTGEFTSTTFPFAAQAGRGVTVTEVAGDRLLDEVHRHDVVAVSVVQSADGAVVDLAGLRAAAEAAGTRVLVDVTQAAGWLPLRLHWADWVVCAGYKWLLAPRGAAWLGGKPDAMAMLNPDSANWYAGADPWNSVYGLPLRLADGARRLDLSPVWFAQVGAAAVLPWLAGLDLDQVRAHCVGLADSLLAGLDLPPRGSAIVSLDRPDAPRRLAEAGIRVSRRAGRARLAFHLYNTADDVDRVLTVLRPGAGPLS